MAISTMHTYLMSFPSSTTSAPTSSDLSKATKVMDITSYPDLGGDPNQLDTTTLSDEIQTHINGLQKMDSMKFGAHLEPAQFKTVRANDGKSQWYGVFFGADSAGNPDGHNAIVVWKGSSTTYINSGKTDEVVDITMVISCETKLSYVEKAGA